MAAFSGVLTNTVPDITPWGGDSYSIGDPSSSDSIVASLNAEEIRLFGFLAASGIPNNDSWESGGTWTVEYRSIVGNHKMQGRARCVRYDSVGNFLQSGATTAAQMLSANRTFTLINPTWNTGEEDVDNRLAVVLVVTNLDTTMIQSCTFGVNTLDEEVITNISLIVGATQITASGDLFIKGSISVSSSGDLVVQGLDIISTSGDLFISGPNQINASGDLFISGRDTISSSGDLFIEGSDNISSSGTLFTLGIDVIQTSGDFFISGKDTATTSDDLFIEGHATFMASGDLFIQGLEIITTSDDLFMHGHEVIASKYISTSDTIVFGNEFEFVGSGSAIYNSVVVINPSKFIVAYRDDADSGNGTAKIGSISGTNIVFGDESEFVTGSPGANYVKIGLLNDSKFVVVYQDAIDSNHGTAKIGTISGTTITFGLESEFQNLGSVIDIDVSILSDTKFVVCYRDNADSNHGTAKIGMVSGTTITFGAKFEYVSDGTADSTASIALSESKFVVAYRDNVRSNNGTANIGTVSGTTISFGPRSEFHSTGSAFNISLAKISDTKFAVLHRSNGSVKIGTVSDTNISFGTETQTNVGIIVSNAIVALSPNQLIVTYRDFSNSNHGVAKIGIINDTDTTFGPDFEFLSVNGVGYVDAASLNQSKFIVAYADNSDSGHGTLKIGENIVDGDLYTLGHKIVSISGDLFIKGKDTVTTSGNLFIEGLDTIQISGDLFIGGQDTITTSGNLFIQGLDVISKSGDLFTYGLDTSSASGNLFISGPVVVVNSFSVSGDLFIAGFDAIQISGDLYIAGSIFISGQTNLFVGGGGATMEISGSAPLFINGFEPKPGLSCPTLDPTASIQIKPSLIEIYQNRIDALINQLGKNVRFIFDPTLTPCPNCLFDTLRKRSNGIYRTGGPRPFKRGRKCPYCKGRGLLETSVEKCIKCLVKWSPRELKDYGISIENKKGIVRLKTYLTAIDDIIGAKVAIIDYDQTDIVKLKVRKIRGPTPVGLREDRYCISFWELI